MKTEDKKILGNLLKVTFRVCVIEYIEIKEQINYYMQKGDNDNDKIINICENFGRAVNK